MLIKEMINTALDEEFLMDYDLFGWIDPSGKLLLASPAQAASSKLYYHEIMIGEKGFSSKQAAFKEGWVRWLVERNTIYMESNQPVSEQLIKTVQKGVKNIEKVAQDPKKTSHFKGRMARMGEAIFIMGYHLDTKDFHESTDSLKLLVDRMKYNLTPESKEIW